MIVLIPLNINNNNKDIGFIELLNRNLPGGTDKTTKNLRVTGVLGDILAVHLQNTSPKRTLVSTFLLIAFKCRRCYVCRRKDRK